MAKVTTAAEVDQTVRAVLVAKKYQFDPLCPRNHNSGETGCDLIARKGTEQIFIEIEGHDESGSKNEHNFHRSFFRAISRINHTGWNEHSKIAIALPIAFKTGAEARRRNFGPAWDRITQSFPELEIWLVNCQSGSTAIEQMSWGAFGGSSQVTKTVRPPNHGIQKMKVFLERFRRWRERWKMRSLLLWRTELTEYEKKLLIPELQGRAQALSEYFDRVLEVCRTHRRDKTFGASIKNLIDPNQIASQVASVSGQPIPSDEDIAEQHFSQIEQMVIENYRRPLDELLPCFSGIDTIEQLGDVLNRLNLLCSSIVQVKEKVFLYSLQAFYSVHDRQTGQIVGVEPRELTLLLMPFKITLENLHSVADSTSKTIHKWHDEQMEWKTNYLGMVSQRLTRQVQVWTTITAIVLSVGISFVFFVGSNPYEKSLLEHQNGVLGEKLAAAEGNLRQCQATSALPKATPHTGPTSPQSGNTGSDSQEK